MPQYSVFSFILIAVLNTSLSALQRNTNPVIGIISSPDDGNTGFSFIKTIYSEFVEASGARVIPIPWDIDSEKLYVLLNSVNGILYTGGMAEMWIHDNVKGNRSFTEFQIRMTEIFNYVKEANDDGVYFPLYAICQGLESVSITITGDPYLMDNFTHMGVLDTVHLNDNAKNSRMYDGFNQTLATYMGTVKSMFYAHSWGVNTSVPNLYKSMGPENILVTAWSEDLNGKKFIASMEMKEYPIYMVMYHVERCFWEYVHMPEKGHGEEVVFIAKWLSNFLYNEAKKNKNMFKVEDLREALIIEKFNATKVDGKPHGFYYVLNKNSLNKAWTEVEDKNGGNSFILLIIVFAIAGYFAYVKYQRSKEEMKDGEPLLNSQKLTDKHNEGVELKTKTKTGFDNA